MQRAENNLVVDAVARANDWPACLDHTSCIDIIFRYQGCPGWIEALFRTAVHLLDFIYACTWLRCLELRPRSHPRQDPHGHKRSIGFVQLAAQKVRQPVAQPDL